MPPDADGGRSGHSGSLPTGASAAQAAVEFARQADKLSQDNDRPDRVAVEAHFVTPQDPVIVTADGNRLPGVPIPEAHKLNVLRDKVEGTSSRQDEDNVQDAVAASNSSGDLLTVAHKHHGKTVQQHGTGPLQKSMPPSHTNPLFPPLPLYGPPSILRDIQALIFRFSAFFLSAAFLGVIVLGSLFTSIPPFLSKLWMRARSRDPDAQRPFFEEEVRRRNLRQEQNASKKRRKSQDRPPPDREGFPPTEFGPDPVICDAGYYARRVGLDIEEFQVQTEDGFIIDLWHVYDPNEYTELDDGERSHRQPEIFTGQSRKKLKNPNQKRKFPVLLLHGLLQSSGAYCVNDDDSLAFYLCKSGYDVWLGNNRCGFKPKHALLDYSDPRMWCWNIRQMGVFDLSALTSRVLFETGFEKIGLICHSQGTTQTFVALAKEQRPEIGEKLTVFCALAPAAYAGPLIGKMYLKFMRIISPSAFRLMFGIHAFIPFMMTMHGLLPPGLYGWLGYKVFSFMFDWTDTRWDRGLRDRMFQFAPVYVSAESMRWWLGRECFAKHKCILSTKEEWQAEDQEDQTDGVLASSESSPSPSDRPAASTRRRHGQRRSPKGSTAWYNEQVCPFALWVAGNDDLVDGAKLLRRLYSGREPHVRMVHSKTIPEYEHLDVIWAMDAPEQIFREIREVLWKTCDARSLCRVPSGCEDVPVWRPEDALQEECDDDDDDDDDDDGKSSTDS